jgi:tripartite-type tricarboxylate transporter receptor subunit TctC
VEEQQRRLAMLMEETMREFARIWTGIMAILGAMLVSPALQAQAPYPSKPIEIIVPFVPGGSTDLGARIFAEALQARWSVPVKVINRPGGNTVPGVEEVVRSAPDGYTILMDGPGSSSMIETIVKSLPFKLEDRTFLALGAQTPLMLVVSTDSPFKTLADAVDAAKRDPAAFSWTSGPGTTDLTFRRLFQIAGIEPAQTRAVQVKGGAEAITLTAGGHVKIGVGFWGTVAPLVSAGKLRVLAVAGPQRFPAIPDAPTTAEAGFPDLIILQWIGFSGPAGLPPEIVSTWEQSIAAVSKEPTVLQGLERIGLVPYPSTAEGMRSYVLQEAKVVQDLWRN